ncbi:MAG: S-layer homology domain-containing protein, partial [Bacillota bacterium]|nr:S-layer homology domain-containing protein [Bacillota bacterium]
MKRSLLCVAMAICLLFAMSTGVFALDFSDVKSNDWFVEDLTDAVDAGIIKGYEDGTFRPNEMVSRAEMVAMFNRALDIKYSRSISYTDVKAKEWFTNDVEKAQYAGIVNGYDDGTFRPNNPILRVEAGALMGRIITKGDYEGYNELQNFKDFASIGSWAWDDLGLAYRKQYIQGYPDGAFGPERNLTRAEAITIVMRILKGEKVVTDAVSFTSNGDALRGT